MTLAVKGKTTETAIDLSKKVVNMLSGNEPMNPEEWGDIAALNGVRQFPARIKCATLAWHALLSALLGRNLL